jgi:hypothetical protein
MDLLVLMFVKTLPSEKRTELLVRAISAGVIGGLIMWGLVAGHRLAWQWGRVFGILGGILWILAGILALSAPKLQEDLGLRLVSGIVSFIGAAFGFTIAIVLGIRSAKIYFNLRCPRCGAMSSQAADFFFNTARCQRCDCRW